MKKFILILLSGSFLISCSRNTSSDKNNVNRGLRKEAMEFASSYISTKFREPVKKTSSDGTITITEEKTYYIIKPSQVYTGLIDGDADEDAIVSADYFNDQNLVLTDHLILLRVNGKLILNREMESDMRIINIKNRIITAEIYTKSRNSPLAECGHCKEVVKYIFKSGELIKTE